MSLAAAPSLAAAAQSARPAAVIEVTGFRVRVQNGRLRLQWRRYKPDDFSAYVVVKSTSPEGSLLPQGQVIARASDQGALVFEEGPLTPGVWYYRVHILTAFGDVWASPPERVEILPEQVRRLPPTAADFE